MQQSVSVHSQLLHAPSDPSTPCFLLCSNLGHGLRLYTLATNIKTVLTIPVFTLTYAHRARSITGSVEQGVEQEAARVG